MDLSSLSFSFSWLLTPMGSCRYKEVSYKLENKVIELTQTLDEEKNHAKQLQGKNESLVEETASLKQKLESFKPYKAKYEELLALKADLERQLEELLQSSLKEKADLTKRLSERDALLHQKEADFEKVRTQLESEKKQVKELHDTLKQAHQSLLLEITKERQDSTEKAAQQSDKINKANAEAEKVNSQLIKRVASGGEKTNLCLRSPTDCPRIGRGEAQNGGVECLSRPPAKRHDCPGWNETRPR